MIDFRYHLVSLISVFLALAVGIVLGAGPLKESIGDTLTGEVDALRQRAADLRTELDASAAELADSRAAFASVADDLLAGTLEDRRVALVTFGDADGGAAADVAARFEEAGATVSARVRLTDDWVDPTRATFRQTLGGTLVEYLEPAPDAAAGSGTELAEALVQGLSNAVPEDPDRLTENAAVVLQLLTESGLIEVDGEVALPADGVVVVAGGFDGRLADEPEETAAPTRADDLQDTVDRWVAVTRELAFAARQRTDGVVVAGHEAVDGGLLAQLREGQDTAARASTVSDVQDLVGQVSVPLAFAERVAGTVGHYGPGGGTTAPVPPRVQLPPPQRIPQLPVGDPGAGTDPGGTADGTVDGTTDGAGEQTADPAG